MEIPVHMQEGMHTSAMFLTAKAGLGALIVGILALPSSGAPQGPPANPLIAPYVGNWMAEGWSWEVRFRQSAKDFTGQFMPATLAQQRQGIQGNVMELVVKHATTFAFTIDKSGNATGEGVIVYDVSPNLCGLAALAKQVNEQINMMSKLPSIFQAANAIGTEAIKTFVATMDRKEGLAAMVPEILKTGRDQVFDSLGETYVKKLEALDQAEESEAAGCTQVGPTTLDQFIRGMENRLIGAAVSPLAAADLNNVLGAAPGLILAIPGVTQVAYSYKGMVNGPEKRTFKVKGNLVPQGSGAKLLLAMDGDVQGGPNKLTLEYSVNYKKGGGSFPTFSPFLADPGDGKASGVVTTHEIAAPANGAKSTGAGATAPQVASRQIGMTSPFAVFDETGQHRTGNQAWHEYEYYWYAQKVK